MSKLVWEIVGDYESCHMPHILIEERKHEDAVESIFACLDCLEDGIRGVEQERIIKLLKTTMAECSENKKPEGCEACYGLRDAITLIKGENK